MKFSGTLPATYSRFFESTLSPSQFYRFTSLNSIAKTCCSLHCNPKPPHPSFLIILTHKKSVSNAGWKSSTN